jgi:hypothetical protein
MSNGPPMGFCSSSAFDFAPFCFGFRSNASNLVWSTISCQMFVDCVGSDQLFIDSSFVSKNICEFLELEVFVCSPNVFGEYFDPYISLGLE